MGCRVITRTGLLCHVNIPTGNTVLCNYTDWLTVSCDYTDWLTVPCDYTDWLTVLCDYTDWLTVSCEYTDWLTVSNDYMDWLTVLCDYTDWLTVSCDCTDWLTVLCDYTDLLMSLVYVCMNVCMAHSESYLSQNVVNQPTHSFLGLFYIGDFSRDFSFTLVNLDIFGQKNLSRKLGMSFYQISLNYPLLSKNPCQKNNSIEQS